MDGDPPMGRRVLFFTSQSRPFSHGLELGPGDFGVAIARPKAAIGAGDHVFALPGAAETWARTLLADLDPAHPLADVATKTLRLTYLPSLTWSMPAAICRSTTSLTAPGRRPAKASPVSSTRV